jgi:hypothetical protein
MTLINPTSMIWIIFGTAFVIFAAWVIYDAAAHDKPGKGRERH